MEIIQDSTDGLQITAYDKSGISINGKPYFQSLIVSPKQLICPWTDQAFNALTEMDFTQLETLQPKIVLLGTGSLQHYPSPNLMMWFHQHEIGLECMSTAAACRTYSVLAAEGREVLAGLIIDKE